METLSRQWLFGCCLRTRERGESNCISESFKNKEAKHLSFQPHIPLCHLLRVKKNYNKERNVTFLTNAIVASSSAWVKASAPNAMNSSLSDNMVSQQRDIMALSSVCCTYMSHLYIVSFKAEIIQTSTKLNLLFRTRAWLYSQFESNVDVDIISKDKSKCCFNKLIALKMFWPHRYYYEFCMWTRVNLAGKCSSRRHFTTDYLLKWLKTS